MAARKLQRSHAALKGIDSRNGFLSDETLLQFVGGEGFNNILKKHQNERLRAFRDQYREFDQKIQKTKDSNAKHGEKRRNLLNDWFRAVQRYFGYSDFAQESIPHWDGEGFVPYLKSQNGSHSVAVLFAADESMPLDVESSGYVLTTANGEKTNEANKKETLSEQTERLIKLAGCAEAVLFLPNSAYYFRSESQTAGQYLEIRWSDILLDDNDAALSLATHLLSSDFFAYSQAEESSLSTDVEAKDDEAGDEDGDDDAVGTSVKTQATASSLLFREDLEQARKITEDLHKQVTLALELLINERLQIDSALRQKAKTQAHNEKAAHDLFKDGLFVLYRVLFILYAEARRFLPVENSQYASFYSIEHLRNWAEEFLKRERQGLADPEGTYLWGALKSQFTLLRRGIKLHGGEFVSAFNGQLFAPDQAPLFDDGPALRDKAIAQVLLTLTRVGGQESGRRLHFANLGVEQLGAVYEALLAQKPVIVREESIWVPAHGGGVGLVTKRLAEALEMTQFEEPETIGLRATRKKKSKRAAAGSLDTHISPERPAHRPILGTFIIAPLGGQKRQTASFYTPPKLAEFLVKRTLKPLAEGKSTKEILSLRIVEPAVGSGGFLIATLRYLGKELLRAKVRENDLSVRGREATYEDLQESKRQILENCLFGVDMNPLSLELCRTSLYLEALVKNRPLPFLHHRLKSGNSLIYADYLNQSRTSWDENTEFPSIFNIFTEALDVDKKIFEAWDAKQKASGRPEDSAEIKEQISELKSKLKDERKKFGDEGWADWAIKAQIELSKMLQNARKAVTEFERIQEKGEIVDSLDSRHKDRLAWIPELDDVLIEAEGIEIDAKLEDQRRKALIREHGIDGYNKMVRYHRAFARLKALGDLWCAQWFWPLDQMEHFPTLNTIRELVDYLLNNQTLDRTVRHKGKALSRSTFQSLRAGLAVAKVHRCYQWQIEFAQVFSDSNISGFSTVISNPPWKVVGVKDKDVYPEFDPQFLATKPSEKSKRIIKLVGKDPNAANAWFAKSESTGRLSKLWKQRLLSPLETSGKIDLAVLFTLAAERLLRQNGRVGLITSRAAVFSNGGTTALRERFFKEWGLLEAISFSNQMQIFEIDSRFDFVTLIGQPGADVKRPRFVHGVIDLNTLDSVSQNLDAKDTTKLTSGHIPIEMDLTSIKYLSRETLSIPGFAHPRQAEIARAIHEASGPTIYIKDLPCKVVQGINQTTGPSNGLSVLGQDLSSSIKKSIKSDLGSHTTYAPLFRGRDYDRFSFDPPDDFYQYGLKEEISRKGVDVNLPQVVWRGISQASDQRTLIVTILPPGTFVDYSSTAISIGNSQHELALLLGCLPADYLMKLQGGSNRTQGQLEAIPLANYYSGYLRTALKILKGNKIDDNANAKIDALIWLHYGFKQPAMQREGLVWALENQFDTLKRNSPVYVDLILKHYDLYSGDEGLKDVEPLPVFKSIPKILDLPSEPSAKKGRKTKRGA